MNNQLLEEVTNEYLKEGRDQFKVGDGVKVHVRVREGEKERIQIFAGIVIARKGSGIHETFTVRRIASGVGVERVFPVHSPLIDRVEVDRESMKFFACFIFLCFFRENTILYYLVQFQHLLFHGLFYL